MSKVEGSAFRNGSIVHAIVNGTIYKMAIWRDGKRFCGRVEDHPQVPEQTASTALGVRDALRDWLVTAQQK